MVVDDTKASGLTGTAFPPEAAPENDVVGDVATYLTANQYRPDRNFAVLQSGIPAPICRKLDALLEGCFFVEWAADTEKGTMALEREAVGMVASLLGQPSASGFITTSGTESNLFAMTLARNLGRQAQPEVVGPSSLHFSLRLAAELTGVNLVEVETELPSLRVDVSQVEKALTPRTVGLVCSAGTSLLATIDQVEEFADLAWRKGLFLHVDAAFGGFILPFMRDLGYEVPNFDLSVRGVSSICTDGHKLGMMPLATSFVLVNDPGVLKAIPIDKTVLHTPSSTKPGSRAAAAWAVMRSYGRTGYQASTAHVLRLRDLIVDRVTAVPGVRTLVDPVMNVVALTSDGADMNEVHQRLDRDGWGHRLGVLGGTEFVRLSIHPSRTEEVAVEFAEAFANAAVSARTEKATKPR
jgi:tyrosine decarboxylase/aspartate 1-decarboxylase